MSSKNNNKQDIQIAKIQSDVSYIKEDISDIKNNHLKHIYDKLECFEKRLLGRPSWITSMVITILGSVLIGLVVYFLTH